MLPGDLVIIRISKRMGSVAQRRVPLQFDTSEPRRSFSRVIIPDAFVKDNSLAIFVTRSHDDFASIFGGTRMTFYQIVFEGRLVWIGSDGSPGADDIRFESV